MKATPFLLLILVVIFFAYKPDIKMAITHPYTLDSLGACQGISNQNGQYFLYGDREVGVIRAYKLKGDTLEYANKEMRLTLNDTDVINHPTGIAFLNKKLPVFIGNSVRLSKEKNLWKAIIYCVDWEGLQRTGTLDNNLINTIDDDACIQGTRPEYVEYKKNGMWPQPITAPTETK